MDPLNGSSSVEFRIFCFSWGESSQLTWLPGWCFLVARREFDTAIVVVDPGSEFLVICFKGFILNGSKWCSQFIFSRIGLASL